MHLGRKSTGNVQSTWVLQDLSHSPPPFPLVLMDEPRARPEPEFPFGPRREGEERSESGGKKADISSRFTQDAPVLEPRVLHPSDHLVT